MVEGDFFYLDKECLEFGFQAWARVCLNGWITWSRNVDCDEHGFNSPWVVLK